MPLALTAAIFHFGLMDGSAGIAVSPGTFLSVSDEVNHIMRFSTTEGSSGEMALNLNEQTEWLGDLRKKKPGKFYELDLEGAAQVQQTIYWIASHGYDEEKDESHHHRAFFATTLGADGQLTPVGQVCRGLLDNLVAEESLKDFGLAEASKITPKDPGGLNIESLCTAADGKTLLIGFRNPIPGGKALLVPLLNPADVVAGTAKARFGPPGLLALGGLGLRDMVWWRGQYLILAGHYDSHLNDQGKPDPKVPASQLYRWSGAAEQEPRQLDLDLSLLNPEALIVFPDDRVLILSDDGGWQKEAAKNDPGFITRFRSVWLEGTE